MFFKKILTGFILLQLAACGMVKDNPKPGQSFQSKSLDLSCLKIAPTQLQNLYNGAYTSSDADRDQIRELWACIDHALTTFSRNTRGANPDFYSAKELQQFANRYVPADQALTDSFVNSIFKLKMDVVGGTETELTRSEIAEAIQKLNHFGTIIEPLAPYISVLLAKNAATEEAKRVAGIQLNTFVLGLSEILSDSANPILWSDLGYFIENLEQYTRQGSTSSLTIVREQLPIYQYVKLLVVGGKVESIEREKWQSILQSISHVYSAMFLTSTSAEKLEQLKIEVQSNEQEQKTAVDLLRATLLRLKNDETVRWKKSIVSMSDSLAKMLLLNTILFPRTEGSLSLKPFLESDSMRKLAGMLVDESSLFKQKNIPRKDLQVLIDHLMTLFDQAAISNSSQDGANTPISITALQKLLKSLDPMFTNSTDADLLSSILSTLKDLIPVLIDKDADHLTTADLRTLVQKGVDLYYIWVPETSSNLDEKIGASLDIILRSPGPKTITAAQIFTCIDNIKRLLSQFKIVTTLDWNLVTDYVKKGFHVKSILFQSSEESLSSAELAQLSYLWVPFRRTDDLGEALAATANLLANHPFATVQITDLISVVDTFLPSGKGLASYGIDATLLGDIKKVLVGGKQAEIAPAEYAPLARVFSALYSNLYPKVKALPPHFQPGINSLTIDLAKAFIQGFMDARHDPISLVDVKALLLDVFKSRNFNVRPYTVDELLVGVTTRILMQSKAEKPKSVYGMFLTPSQFAIFFPFLDTLQAQLKDIENAYSGRDVRTQSFSRAELVNRLKDPTNLLLVNSLQPLLDGSTHLHHFKTKGVAHDQFYQFDVAYKSLIHATITWLIPFYKRQVDPKIKNDPEMLRTRLSLLDLTDLLTDINDLIYDLKLSFANTTASHSAKVRMENMNLFTQVGNGDEYMDPLEADEFLTITLGGKVLLGSIEDAVFPKCFPGIKDYDQVKKIPYACLSKVFFSSEFQRATYGPVVPELIDQYVKWSPTDLEIYRKAAFTATSPGWKEDGAMLIDDFETFVSLPYFLENIYERFDVNEDDTLQFSEIMAGFPVFCREINASAGGKLKGSCVPGEDPKQIEAIYGYLIFNGHPPTGLDAGYSIWTRIRSSADVLLWFKKWKNLDRNPAVRDHNPPYIGRQDLLNIMSNLSASTADSNNAPEGDQVQP